MTVATLFQGITSAQTLPVPSETATPGGNLPSGCQAFNPSFGAGSPNALPNPTFQVILTDQSQGVTCSCTVQPLGSNDGIHWSGAGAAVTLASGPSPQTGSSSITSQFLYFAAYVQAITGTKPQAKCLVNA